MHHQTSSRSSRYACISCGKTLLSSTIRRARNFDIVSILPFRLSFLTCVTYKLITKNHHTKNNSLPVLAPCSSSCTSWGSFHRQDIQRPQRAPVCHWNDDSICLSPAGRSPCSPVSYSVQPEATQTWNEDNKRTSLSIYRPTCPWGWKSETTIASCRQFSANTSSCSSIRCTARSFWCASAINLRSETISRVWKWRAKQI